MDNSADVSSIKTVEQKEWFILPYELISLKSAVRL